MARLIISQLASFDQAEILSDLAERAGHPTAVKFRLMFFELFQRLASHPDSGARRPGLGRTIRVGVVWPYVVLYRHSEPNDEVTILRVLHGRRKIAGALIRRDTTGKTSA